MRALFLVSLLPLLLLLSLGSALDHFCSHDDYVSNQSHAVIAHQVYTRQEAVANGRLLAASSRLPIRILVDSSQLAVSADFTLTQLQHLTSVVLPAAIANISALLAVDRVTGNLTASRECTTGYYTSGAQKGVCAGYSTALPTCNTSPTVTIPLAYLAPAYTNCATSSNIPGSCTIIPGGTGIPNVDYVVFVTALQTSRCPAAGQSGTLAFAADCQRDQMDRPIFGSINFCPYAVPSASGQSQTSVLGTAIHELVHALGFTSRSWPLFRDALGAPLTPRDPVFPHTASSDYDIVVNCQGSVQDFAVPGPNVVTNSTTPRGYSCSSPSDPLSCARFMSSPKVLQVGRDFFACAALQGVELENQDASCSPVGSHWEQRLLQTELMSPVVNSDSYYISPITLALLEDSGWYSADYSKLPGARRGQTWGYKQGCAFATEKCLNSTQGSTGSPPHFLSFTSQAYGCMVDGRSKGAWDGQLTNTALQVPMRYPTTTAGVYYASSLSQRDYCPSWCCHTLTHRMPLARLSSGDCTFADTAVTSGNPYGEVFGSNGHCFSGTLLKNTYVQSNTQHGMCFSVTCTSTSSYTVTLSTGSVTCSSAGTQRTVSGYSGYFVCTDPAVVCAPTDPPYAPPWVEATSTPTVSATASVSFIGSASPSFSVTRTPTPSQTSGLPPSPSPTLIASPSSSASFASSPDAPASSSSSEVRSAAASPTGTMSSAPSFDPASSSSTPSTEASPTSSPSSSRSSSPAPSPQRCVLGDSFGPWQACVAPPCTTTGTQARSKPVLQYPVGSGTACDVSSAVQVRSCTSSYDPSLPCPLCSNGVRDTLETDIDCGGTSSCSRCDSGLYCNSDSDCAAGFECGTVRLCIEYGAASTPFYAKSSLTLTAVHTDQFKGAAVTAFKAAVAAQLTLQGQPMSASSVFVTSLFAYPGPVLAVDFVVAAPSWEVALLRAAAIGASVPNDVMNTRVAVALAPFAPTATIKFSITPPSSHSSSSQPLGPVPTPSPRPESAFHRLLLPIAAGGGGLLLLVVGVVGFVCISQRAKRGHAASKHTTTVSVRLSGRNSLVESMHRTAAGPVQLRSWGDSNPLTGLPPGPSRATPPLPPPTHTSRAQRSAAAAVPPAPAPPNWMNAVTALVEPVPTRRR